MSGFTKMTAFLDNLRCHVGEGSIALVGMALALLTVISLGLMPVLVVGRV